MQSQRVSICRMLSGRLACETMLSLDQFVDIKSRLRCHDESVMTSSWQWWLTLPLAWIRCHMELLNDPIITIARTKLFIEVRQPIRAVYVFQPIVLRALAFVAESLIKTQSVAQFSFTCLAESRSNNEKGFYKSSCTIVKFIVHTFTVDFVQQLWSLLKRFWSWLSEID